MRPIIWLHLSDFHLRDSQGWAQDVVLSAMCQDIARRREAIGAIDFVLASGDLAFAGKANEYDRVRAFFNELARVSGVPADRIFCIPGNHDVDRDRQKMCFAGARHVLQSQNEIDVFLGAPDEVATLLQRQEHYYRFQESYLAAQGRTWTPDRLGYVSIVTIEGLRLAIVGLNTAWLSEGGISDHGKLLTGERQVIDALRIANEAAPHLVIAMGHHPFHLLNDFDRGPVQRRAEEACQFFHCGHLHSPESHDSMWAGASCLTVTAGASFDSRHTDNSYSLVTLDVMQAQRTVKTIQYKPKDGTFAYETSKSFPLVINAVAPCTMSDLGQAIEAYRPALSAVAYYIAALLVEAQTEVPIAVGNSHAFGSIDLLEEQPDSDLRSTTMSFMAVRNPLRLLGGDMTLADFLARYGASIERFGTKLDALCKVDNGLREKLAERESDARILAGSEPLQPFDHTLALLRELAADQEWELLRVQAERHLDSAEATVAAEAKRMLALCLAHSVEDAEKKQSIELYRELLDRGTAEAADIAALAALLIDSGDSDAAKEVLLKGIERFPEAADGYLALGQRIVEATGDRAFREELESRRTARRTA